MLWLTLRQHRAQVLVTFGLLAVLGVVLLVHGLSAAGYAATNRPPGCPGADAACGRFEAAMGERFQPIGQLIDWLPIAPALIGVFWGAPVLAREFERGTHTLAWTQSVSPGRWLAVKLGVLGGLVALTGLAFGGLISAWQSVFDGTIYADSFGQSAFFMLTGVLPAAWWLFAFAVGTAAGALIRRTVPAIAVTVAAVLALVLAAFVLDVRTYYAPIERTELAAGQVAQFLTAGVQVRDSAYQTPDGRELSAAALRAECPYQTAAACFGEGGRHVYYYQPADRYWRFQWTEAALLLLLALGLSGLTVRRAIRTA